MSFDKDKINILEIISNNNDFNDSNYSLNKLAEGLIPFSWNGVLSSPEIFRIKIEVKADCILEDIFKLNSNLILSEGYLKKNLIPTAIELRVNNGKSSHFSMEQNMPNPWTRNTKVMYSIPTDGNVVFRITSLEGRTIFEKKMIQKQGSHEWQITKKDVSGHGYYLYSIEFNGQLLSKPMVINE